MAPLIQLKGVSRAYQLGGNAVSALTHVDLEINQGDFIALVGPSGSGKSTLLNLLGGLDRPTSGEIFIDGIGLHDAGEEDLTAHRRYNVGFIFQTFNLISTLTALENVSLPLMLGGVSGSEREARAKELLARVGLADRLDHRPAELSGGEQQRTAIARALVNHPRLILADEPTGNLDSSTGAEVMKLLRELNFERGVTLIIVTHDAEIAAFADRVVHLKDGAITEIETLDQTQTSRPVPQPAQTGTRGKDRMKFSDLVRSAFLNLRRQAFRNLLTAAGVLIGIVTLVAMVSFGVGVQNEVNLGFQALGLENVFVFPTFPEQDAFDPFGIPKPLQPLTPDFVNTFRAMPEVQSVTPVLDLPPSLEISLTYGEITRPVLLSRGLGSNQFGPPSVMMENDILAGSPLAEGDSQGIVIIDGLADLLIEGSGLYYPDLIGQTATLTVRLPRGETNEFRSTIVGVRKSFGERTIDLGLEERAAIKAWWFGRPDTLTSDGYDALIVKAIDEKQVVNIVQMAEGLAFQAQSLGAILELANRVLAILQALLGSVGSLALLVATLGVANTMMMAIYERTREIGILKALGARNREVQRMFTADAILIGLIGGVVGVIVGTALGRLVDWVAHQYMNAEGITGVGQLSIVPPWLAIGALVFAGLVGVLGGLYPAARAARLDPVAALRHD